MPAYLTSLAWTGPIAVAAGDVLQNTGTRSIFVCAEDEPDADDSLLIRPRSWYTCAAAMTIRAATHGVGIGCLSIASGLGEDDGVEPVEPTAPGTFAPHQWTVSTGAASGAVIMDISGRPSTGGAALTALEYTVQDGEDAPGTALAGLGTGQRVLTMPEEDTEYSFRVRARNSVGPGPWSEPQAAVSGAAAELPSFEATITTDPLVAGEDFEIVFDAAPDSVSPPSLVQDANDPRRYTGTAPDSGTMAIGATKAGYQVFGQTYTYDPAPVVEPGSITVESDGTISITLPDSVTEPFDVQIAGEVVTLDPAAYTPTSAPVALGQPEIAGTGGDGEVLTVQSRALSAGHADAGEIAIVGGWYRNDTAVGDTDGSYTQDDAVDGDRTLTWRETATNAAGSTVAVSNGVLCPAAEIPALPAGLSVVGLFEGEPSGGLTATHTAPISLGGADPQKSIYVLVRALSSASSGKIIVGGTEYPLTLHHTVTMAGGNNRMALLSAAIPAGGTGTLSITTSGTWSGALIAYVMTTKAMTLVTSGMTGGVTMTAGTAITQTATTLVGDHLLAAVMAAPYDAAGIFGSPVAVTERLDHPLTATGPQLWVGTGVETAAASPRSVQVTPSQPGNAIRLLAQFRSA